MISVILLISGCAIADVDKSPLPNSMKGYELYSWMENGEWNFTLITGTNRNKTVEEIVADGNIVSEGGWVQIHVKGAEAIKTVLGRLPENEEVFWAGGFRGETPSDINFSLPSGQITDDIKQFAESKGVNLQTLSLSVPVARILAQ